MMSNPEILVLDDFSPLSNKALELAGVWAHALNFSLAALHICVEPEACEDAKERMRERAVKLAQPGLAKAFARTGNLFQEIRSCYIHEHPALMVFGTHGIHGFSPMLFGANSMRIVADTACPALLLQQQTPRRLPARWLVLNNTPWDAHSIQRLCGLMKSAAGQATLLHIGLNMDDLSNEDTAALDVSCHLFRDAGVQVHAEATVRKGFGAGLSHQVYDYLGQGGYDLLVMSRQAYPVLGKAAYDADCEALVNNPAGIPVLFI
jgi:nucleotide-binding universal stress UspA family protein